jgi:transposase
VKNCRFCNAEKLVKHAFINGKQRYICRVCGRNQLEKDGRQKYDEEVVKTAFILFSEGNNYRAIARILNKVFRVNISYQLVIYWVQKKVSEIPENTDNNRVSRDVAIVEMDELYTFFKNEKIKSEFGLLLTETRSICLHFGPALEQKSPQEGFLKKSHITK